MATRTKGLDLPAGVHRRHQRGCPAVGSDDLSVCRCRPAYQAQAGPRRARQTKTFATLAAAKAWKRDTDRAFEHGEAQVTRAPVLRDAADRWLTAAEAGVVLARGDKPYRRSTLRGYRRSMTTDLYPVFGDRRLDRIERRELGEFVMALTARGISASTVRNIVIPLRALYRHAIYLDQVAVNPTVGLKVPAGSGRRLRFMAPDDIGPHVAALGERDRPLWATAIYAGLRRGELMGLRWSDVDLAGGTITVSVTYDPGSKEMGPVKSDAGQDRRIGICGALRDQLVAHRQRAGARPHGLVFARRSLASQRILPHHAGLPFGDQGVVDRAHRHWAAAGLAPYGLHECRHTFASLMIAATAQANTFNPKLIQEMLGHQSIQQTYDRYGHLFPGSEQQAVRMLDAFLEHDPAAGVRRAVDMLASVLHDADAGAIPEVTQAEQIVRSWLAAHPVLPSVASGPDGGCDHQVRVQHTGVRRVR